MLEDGYENENSVVFFDAKGLTVMPSFIDMHVHLRDPGLTHKEDLNSALHAAVKGGYGTVVAMPNTSPVIHRLNRRVKSTFVQKNLNFRA